MNFEEDFISKYTGFKNCKFTNKQQQIIDNAKVNEINQIDDVIYVKASKSVTNDFYKNRFFFIDKYIYLWTNNSTV